MSQRPPREGKILSSLSKKNHQTFQEIFRDQKMGRKSAKLGFDKLVKDGLIDRDSKTKKYFIKTNIKNKILLAPTKTKRNLMDIDLDLSMQELRVSDTPFELGYTLLRSAMFYLSKLTLEQYAPNLSDIERYECYKLIKRCNDTIEQTFNVLGQIDMPQTLAIKQGLENAITIPGYEKELAKTSTNRQQRRANKISVKILKEVKK